MQGIVSLNGPYSEGQNSQEIAPKTFVLPLVIGKYEKGFSKTRTWVGSWSDLSGWAVGEWMDFYLLLIFGGIPWQVYFQRVLSSDTGEFS